MSTTIFAVDPGKFNSVLCRYEPETDIHDQRSNQPGADERVAVKTMPSEMQLQRSWMCPELSEYGGHESGLALVRLRGPHPPE